MGETRAHGLSRARAYIRVDVCITGDDFFFFLKKVIYASHNVYACICRMYLFVSMYA